MIADEQTKQDAQDEWPQLRYLAPWPNRPPISGKAVTVRGVTYGVLPAAACRGSRIQGRDSSSGIGVFEIHRGSG